MGEELYMVMEETSLTKLIEQVNSYMTAGYKPLGGVSVASDGPDHPLTYVQAIVKEDV
ncbi:MAG: DUF1737 domain-containing protein [Spirochaetia bacterium]|nr:DUF1737 domain-containing protein [Spirochaetia bacterium]